MPSVFVVFMLIAGGIACLIAGSENEDDGNFLAMLALTVVGAVATVAGVIWFFALIIQF